MSARRSTTEVLAAIEQPVLARLRPVFERAGVVPPFAGVDLLAFKAERRLELWVEDGRGGRTFLKTYPFTAFSGTLGPKLREGDRQIPEGGYGVEYLNPNSRHHLSFKLDYPNAFDRAMAAREGRTEPGSDIFIHGGASTVGCIPVGDPAIEELFWLVARSGREQVRVIVAPCDLRRAEPPLPEAAPAWLAGLYRDLAAALEAFTA